MIFASIGLLVVAVVLIVVGIAKSAVAPLVISVLCTVAAGGLLYASFLHYRRRTPAGAVAAPGPGVYSPPGPASGAPTAGTPVPAGVTAAPPAGPVPYPPNPPYVPYPPTNGAAALPEGWADLNADEAISLVETFSLAELHEARKVEVEGKHRKTVLGAIDSRIDHIVEVRKSTAKS